MFGELVSMGDGMCPICGAEKSDFREIEPGEVLG